eukprot:Gregarina_sp_Poly_1__5320@NODE_2813_length_1687_cov_81_469753_g1772_i0_p1_GENE_NODE_2813_length_1687_cov_81_469753_g1772_i0NODE_2813_length_1687_cov_81_469753_g1772_i0_p1_ORF_typecomplete_len344_score28_62Zip/PF02535_22/2_9e43_NODE_2813_length_1687_cov_81_469753_g1772_i021033
MLYFRKMNGIFLALLAGCATGVGALPILWIKTQNASSLAAGMALAAGVMTYLTFVEIYPEVRSIYTEAFRSSRDGDAHILSLACCGGAFFGGWFLADFLNRLLHQLFHEEKCGVDVEPLHSQMSNRINKSELTAFEAQLTLRNIRSTESCGSRAFAGSTPPVVVPKWDVEKIADALADEIFRRDHIRLLRVGWFTALALSMHNFPEGIATYAGAAANGKLGLGIAMAIGIHNLPEGLAVAIPIYYSTHSPTYAVIIATATGMAEPLGAILAWAVIGPTPGPLTYGSLLGLVSGIMINVALKELFFGAARYDPNDHIITRMFVGGMLIMAISLVGLEMLALDHS